MSAALATLVADNPGVLALCGVVVVGHFLLVLLPDLQTVFFLVPGHTLTRPWQVLTCGFLEDSTLNMIVGVIALLGCATLLQRKWGASEFMRFVLLTNALQGCATWVGMIVLYVLFRSEHFLFAKLGGLTGTLTGLSVALMQQAPEQSHATDFLPLFVTGRGHAGMGGAGGHGAAAAVASSGDAIGLALAHAPSVCVLWCTLVLLGTHSGPPDELLFAINGLLCAFLYLRYYQPRQAGPPGDASAHFAFERLFPPPLRPPLRVLGNAWFAAASSCGVFPPLGWGSGLQASAHDGGALVLSPVRQPSGPVDFELELLRTPRPPVAGVTTTDPQLAERRRERARVLIEARLNAGKAAGALAAAGEGHGEGRPSEAVPLSASSAAAAELLALTPATPTTPLAAHESLATAV